MTGTRTLVKLFTCIHARHTGQLRIAVAKMRTQCVILMDCESQESARHASETPEITCDTMLQR